MGGVSGAVTTALVVVGIAIELFCCLGVLVMRDAYSRLHYTAPAGLGAVLLGAAVLVHEGFSLVGDKALLTAVFILVSSPVLAHVTARATRIRTDGDIVLREPSDP